MVTAYTDAPHANGAKRLGRELAVVALLLAPAWLVLFVLPDRRTARR